MSAFSGGLRTTPRTRLPPSNLGPKYSQDDDRVQLSLRTVIGNTTTSPTGFDCDTARNRFVCCAGPASILTDIQEGCVFGQRVFRARVNAVPVNAVPSFYNSATPPTTPTRRKTASPIKDSTFAHSLNVHSEQPSESPGGSKIQYRTREATCVSLDMKGDLLAVGETGYNPRILLFSTSGPAHQDVPLSSLSDHSFGVQSLAFSPDSKWLCSLGNTHDGFLLLYAVNPKTGSARLHASNKCSNVRAITWMGTSIITFGTRHVKVWRIAKPASPRKGRLGVENGGSPSSPGPKTLSGRNCLLGTLIDANFTAAVAIAGDLAILGTFNGDICLLDDGDRTQRLDLLSHVEFPINCIHYDSATDTAVIAGDGGAIATFAVSKTRISGEIDIALHAVTDPSRGNVVAIGKVDSGYVMIDSNHVVDIWTTIPSTNPKSAQGFVKRLSAHESAVVGVCSLEAWKGPVEADFLTYSARGTVLFWRNDGSCSARIEIKFEQSFDSPTSGSNELKAISPSSKRSRLLAGDKSGILHVLEASGESVQTLKAHHSDINNIATAQVEPQNLVCTSSRDRTIQVFRQTADDLSLIQTLDDHAASVTDARFWEKGSLLISISSDRTVVVRKSASVDVDSLAYIVLRVIPLKASPVSFATVPFDPNLLLVSTLDRQVQKIEISSGRLIRSFKALDPFLGESVLLGSLQAYTFDSVEGPTSVIAGFSSTDKSIRLHGYEDGALLAREFGQAAVSGMKILQPRSADGTTNNMLISCGFDGTVMIYCLGISSQNCNDSITKSVRQQADQIPPLRKTLTKREIADFQKALEETENHPATPLQSPSPSRLKTKASNYSLLSKTLSTLPSIPDSQKTSYAPTQRNVSRTHGSRDRSPHRSEKAKKPSLRPSLDPRRRSRSATNLNETSLSSKDLCEALQTFRKRVVNSPAEKEAVQFRDELQVELDLTLQAIRRGHGEMPSISEQSSEPGSRALDDYIAKMIDEKLAVRSVEKKTGTSELESGPMSSEEEVQSGACAG